MIRDLLRNPLRRDMGALSDQARLRHELRTRSAELAAAASGGETIDPDKVEELGRLEELYRMHGTWRASKRGFVYLVVIVLAVVWLLHSIRLREVDVILDLEVTALTLVPTEATDLPRLANLSILQVVDLETTRLPEEILAGRRAVLRIGEQDADAGGDGTTEGAMALESIRVPGGVAVHLLAEDGQESWRLARPERRVEHLGADDPDSSDLRLSVTGPIRVAEPAPRDLVLTWPKPITFSTNRDEIRLFWRRDEDAPELRYPLLQVQDLAVVVNRAEEDRTRVDSHILGGRLAIETLAGKVTTLDREDVLRIGTANGEIRNLRSDGNRLAFRFVGRAGGLEMGHSVVRSLQPTWLEWIYTDPELRNLRTGLLGALSLLAAFAGWLWK